MDAARARTAKCGFAAPAGEDDSDVTYRQGRFWQPDVTVATVVERQGRLLMVEEKAHGRLVLNQPAGHLEPDESLLDAAVREALEESGWDIRLTGFLGAYQWTSAAAEDRPARHYLRFAFIGEPLVHHPGRALDEGIVQALWLAPDELRARAPQHRSPLVWEVVADYLAGRRQSLDLLRQVS